MNDFANKDIGDGIVFDVNSLYPAQMRHRLLPYGHPVYFDGQYEFEEKYPLHIQKITCRFELNEGYIPTIQIKKNMLFRQNEYLKSSRNEEVELCLTNVDLEMFFEHYTVTDVEYHGGWKFKAQTGMFNDFIDKWMKVKKKETGAKKESAKLMLNSLYGKFASNPDVTGKIPYLREDGSTGLRMMQEKEFKDPVYTPMGTFITSWARHTCISSAQLCFDRIIYCDTDSIHLTGLDTPDAIKELVDPDELGYWKYEGAFKKAKYLRQKTYYHVYYAKMDGDKKKQCDPNEATTTIHAVKCAGMPDKVKENVTYETFKIGFSSYGKLLPKHVKGGVVLVDTAFSIT